MFCRADSHADSSQKFTTTTYPPLYNPSLTLSSRRYLTLSPRPCSPPEPTTRPLDTSHGGPPPLRQASFETHFLAADEEAAIDGEAQDRSRPRTASSTFSNPASLPRLRNTTAEGAAAAHAISGDEEKEEDRPPSPSGAEQQHPPQKTACPACRREATTFLVELTSSYPAPLGPDNNSAGGRGYDAVLLVYDVGLRASFDAVSGLAEAVLPLCCDRDRRRERRGRGRGRVVLRGGRSVDEGLNEGKHSSGRTKLQRKGSSSSVAFGANGGTYDRASSSVSFRGSRGPVVALVGNKADFDADDAGVYFGLEAKRAALEEVDVGERGLVHPLYRESRLYGGGDADGGVAIGLPELRSMIAAKPRLAKRDTAASSIRPLLSPYSARSFAWETEVQEERRPAAAAEVDEWPLTRKMGTATEDTEPKQRDTGQQQQHIPPFNADTPATRAHTTRSNANLDSVIRRSAVSADHHLSSNTNNRASILSKRSVRTMQEGSKPLVLTKLPKSEAVENWIRTGSPTTAEHPDPDPEDDESRGTTDDDDGAPGAQRTDDRNRDRSYSTTTTTAAPQRRQVSRLEGEMLARTLLAGGGGGGGGVPFYETSAKTGEGVEEMFEAVVRAVLRRRGVALPDEIAISAACRRKKHVDRKTAVGRRGRKRSEDGPLVELPGVSVGDKEEIPVDAGSQGPVVDAPEDASVSPQIVHRRRRESMLDRFRKVFTRRAAVLVDNAAD